MKKIETLVKDIYGLFDGSTELHLTPEDILSFSAVVAKSLTERVTEQRREPTLRLSNIGTPCERKLWYEINKPEEAEPLRPQTRLKFLLGDLIEHLYIFLAKLSGHKVEGEQDEINVGGILGHRDCIIDGTTIDTKSASPISYGKFEKGITKESDVFGYIDQLQGYIHGSEGDARVTDKDRGGFLAINKSTGECHLDLQPRLGIDYEQLVEHKKQVVNGPLPPRLYEDVAEGKSGNRKLPTICSYCQYKHTCWGNLRTFIYSNGPVYLTRVERTPNVIEIDRHGHAVFAS